MQNLWNENACILNEILLKCFPVIPTATGNKSASPGSGNGLVPSRQQAITWTNTIEFIDAYMYH